MHLFTNNMWYIDKAYEMPFQTHTIPFRNSTRHQILITEGFFRKKIINFSLLQCNPCRLRGDFECSEKSTNFSLNLKYLW